jgi:DNA-binding transcriptional LysR family regulator
MNNAWQWDDIRFFLAVARAGSLSGAARTLDVGHVTVGRRVAELERTLGTRLLAKTPDGFTVTPEGQAILQQCAEMEKVALTVERIAAGRDARVSGSLRLTATEPIAYQVLLPVIARLRRDYPELQFDIIAGVRTLDIARRDADLAVRFARPTNSELVVRKLGVVGFSLYASEHYLADRGIPRRGEGLGGHDVITFTRAPTAASPFFLGESLSGARVPARCDNPLLQVEAAANHLGIAELACFIGDGHADLRRIWPDEAPALRTAWLIFHQDLRRSARVKLVSAALADEFRRQRRVLEGGRA